MPQRYDGAHAQKHYRLGWRPCPRMLKDTTTRPKHRRAGYFTARQLFEGVEGGFAEARIDPRDGEREVVMARWGLIPAG